MSFDRRLYSDTSSAVSRWLIDYFDGLDGMAVRSNAAPGEIKSMVPASPPDKGERFADMLADFDALAAKGLTHWNHPRFFAYFPCSTSPVALAAEQLTSALSQQGMLWQTSPLSTELEGRVIEWMIALLGLEGQGFTGVINDTASTSTFSAVVMARERATQFSARNKGLAGQQPLRVYVSPEAHSSIKKAVWLAGLGQDNVVEIATDDQDRMDIDALRATIAADRNAGKMPAMIVGAAGGTSVGAFDDLTAMAKVADLEDLFFHVDAAWAGVAAIHPDFRPLFEGWGKADSIVLNPHKWLMTGMECSVFLVKDPKLLTQSMSIMPSYLESHLEEPVINFSEWTPQLGRGFRSLKLWFVIRHYGAEGLAAILKDHVDWSAQLCERLRAHPHISIMTEPSLSLFSFALPTCGQTLALVKSINDDGRIYLTQSSYKGRTVVRFVTGTVSCRHQDVQLAGAVIEELAAKVLAR